MWLRARATKKRLVRVLREQMAAVGGGVVVDGGVEEDWLASRVRMQRSRAKWMRL
jgi:hypothetical protein